MHYSSRMKRERLTRRIHPALSASAVCLRIAVANVILVLQTLVLTASAETALTLRREEWKQCVHFPAEEQTLKPPEALSLLNPKLLDPALEGSFAQHTLLNRLPAVVSRLIADGAVDDSSVQRLRALSAEVPTLVPLRLPQAIVPSSGGGLGVDEVFCAHFNGEWQRWATERAAAKHWSSALPLISLEMYFYRRVLDCTGYFGGGESGGKASDKEALQQGRVLEDPFESMKSEALASALTSPLLKRTLEHHLKQMRGMTGASMVSAFFSRDAAERKKFLSSLASTTLPDYFSSLQASVVGALKVSLWGNRGDLALAPADKRNTQEAAQIGQADCDCAGLDSNLLVDETEEVFNHLLHAAKAAPGASQRVDIVLDNSGIELLCDLVLADVLLASGLAACVRLHAKGEPLFISDAMPKDVSSHLRLLRQASDPLLQEFGARLEKRIEEGVLQICTHQFWTAPRLFWEMPVSLARELSGALLVIVKGDANYRRLIGDRCWPPTTRLEQVVAPWFPANLAALRTMKAEVAVGIDDRLLNTLAARDPNWWTCGKYGSIQFVARSERCAHLGTHSLEEDESASQNKMSELLRVAAGGNVSQVAQLKEMLGLK